MGVAIKIRRPRSEVGIVYIAVVTGKGSLDSLIRGREVRYRCGY